MRLVMLHLHERDSPVSSESAGPAGREIAGMHVGRDDRRLDAEEPHQVGGRAVQRLERFQIPHVADVLAHDRLIVMSQADGRLEFAAHGENGRPCFP